MNSSPSVGRKRSGLSFIPHVILGFFGILSIFPFYTVLISSFASFEAITSKKVYLFPTSFVLTNYKTILTQDQFFSSLGVTIFITVVGVSINMFLSVTGAYALSKKQLPGRNLFLSLIIFTMFFNGGLIPWYLLVKNLGLIDSLFSMILPVGINTFYLIIMKNYFNSLPESLEESAKIDGANDIYILIKIIIPISAPFIATFALFYSVERWNEWYNSLLFIHSPSKAPLQILLRELLINFNTDIGSIGAAIRDSKSIYVQGVQMASIVVTSLPILLIYPFLQKHFASGIMVGSLKE
ncbi:carbohydrate ABC transporter permease [Paenibacillus qinlingensis]|uniref:Aldouronate transport system permease protein n=1 Tax=Paenibacillus qinlingensis TaxID=1837343 RepID=A0ABU1P1C5_9BACL|nr:carbohydrate ABC transporter permease [Paenibacillus qinlingensis]MDR6552907.1 putative aldouronate transport system permease protein [Paenibacillus qinlingensis]